MRAYHFINAQYGLTALRDQRLKVARIDQLNDPFEFLGVELSDRTLRRALTATKRELSTTKGLLCFSKSWHHPMLWAHYADGHRGMCLGFDVNGSKLEHISYVNSRFPKPDRPDEAFVRNLLFTKFSHWSYEDEYRLYVALGEEEGGFYFAPFSDEITLKQVIVGFKSKVSRADLTEALGALSSGVEQFKARPAFRSFKIVRKRNHSRWA